MNINNAYNEWSTTYDSDRNLTRDLDQVVTTESLANRRYNTILEVGCGTGKNTLLLTRLGERVCALDLSVGMLEQARRKTRSERLVLAVADLTKPWPCKTESVDLIVCNLVLEHVRDLSLIFSEAQRTLVAGGQFFISELHPYRQYQGTKANFQRGPETIEIPAFVHHLSDFTKGAKESGFSVHSFREWWHEADQNKPPRLVSFMFEKAGLTK
ncbi:MAG: class I SAM-dependent methyltransferase [Pyrinomonadaceae bacterium]|nr:class I SAM-dependent methyltransferase [Pyrinomonadaceae bacterium]